MQADCSYRCGNRVHVVGIGPEGISSKEIGDISAAADIIIGNTEIISLFKNFRGQLISLDNGGLCYALDVCKKRYKNAEIYVFATGDPNFFGIAKLLRRYIPSEYVKVVPAVSFMQKAFALIGEEWDDAKIISMHGRGCDSFCELVNALIDCSKVGVFTDGENTPSFIASKLLSIGIPPKSFKMFVCERIGHLEECFYNGFLDEIAKKRIKSPNFLIIKREKKGWSPPIRTVFGRSERLFIHKGGLITKPEVRSIVLSKLRLCDGCVLWDVGSGSGSVAVEAALLCKGIKAFAVEKDRQNIFYISENKKRFFTFNVEEVLGDAPQCLLDLPNPDRVFIGGGGKDIYDILKCVWDRINQGGVIVANAVTLVSVEEILRFFADVDAQYEMIVVNVAKARVSQDMEMLPIIRAENPIYIFVCDFINVIKEREN